MSCSSSVLVFLWNKISTHDVLEEAGLLPAYLRLQQSPQYA